MKRTAIASIIGAALLAAVPAAALAAPHPHAATKPTKPDKQQPAVVLGTLSTLTATSVSVAVPGGGTTTVAVDSHTRFLAHSRDAATAGAKTGDPVAVFTTTKGNTTTARIVEYDTVAFGIPLKVRGTITGGTTTSLTVTTSAGKTVNVQITSKTHMDVNGARVTALAVVPTNQTAEIDALQMTTGDTVARNVRIGQQAPHGQKVVLRGTVGGVGGNTVSVVVQKNAAPVQVQLAATTAVVVGGKLSAATSLAPNQTVIIVAARQADGSLLAISVVSR